MAGSGSFRHAVTLETPAPRVADGDGGYAASYVPLAPPAWRCAIEAISAADMERAIGAGAAVVTVATFRVRGRYHAGVTPQTRIRFGARVLEVQSVQNDGTRDRFLTLLCSEVGPP